MSDIFKKFILRNSETESEVNHMVIFELTAWREMVLNKLLVVGILLVFPAALMTILRATQYPKEVPGAIIILVIYLMVVVLALLRQLNPVFRGWMLVLLLYMAGVVSLARGGLVGDGRVYLIVLPILSITLVSVRSGMIMTALGLFTYFAFALFGKFGYLEEWLIIHQNPVTLDHWGYDGLVLAAFMVTMVVLLVNYIQLLMKTLRSEHEISQNLKEAYQIIDQTNLQLEEKVDQRTTELAEANEMLLHLATHDPLTSLPNRTVFYDRLTHALAKAKRLGVSIVVLFIDLDDFKNVNDTFGHLMGDWLLQEIAQRLLGCVRESDTMARLGGDEFAVILEDLRRLEDVAIVAEKIISAVAEEFEIEDRTYHISASVGISVYPVDGDNAEDLIRNSDVAMYRVKNSTKNNYEFFSPTVSSTTVS
jgi:diguanylate cyclase (GGDEF)-like protein